MVGIKFRPAGFYPFYGKSVASFTDDVLSFQDVFAEDIESLESSILSIEETERMAEAGEAFLMRYLPDQDPKRRKPDESLPR